MKKINVSHIVLKSLSDDKYISKGLIIKLPYFSGDSAEVIALNLTEEEVDRAYNILESELYSDMPYEKLEEKAYALEVENEELKERIEALEEALEEYRCRSLRMVL